MVVAMLCTFDRKGFSHHDKYDGGATVYFLITYVIEMNSFLREFISKAFKVFVVVGLYNIMIHNKYMYTTRAYYLQYCGSYALHRRRWTPDAGRRTPDTGRRTLSTIL